MYGVYIALAVAVSGLTLAAALFHAGQRAGQVDRHLSDQDATLAAHGETLAKQDATLDAQNAALAELRATLQALRDQH